MSAITEKKTKKKPLPFNTSLRSMMFLFFVGVHETFDLFRVREFARITVRALVGSVSSRF